MRQWKGAMPRPVILLLVLTAQFAIVVLFYPGYIEYLFSMATFTAAPGLITSVFPFTYASAVLLFLYMVRRFGIHGVGLGVASAFSATSVFEFTYQACLGNLAYWPLNLSAVLWGFVLIPYATASRRFLIVSGLYVALWIGWLALGYPQITDSQASRVYEAYALNIPTKVMTFALYAIALKPRTTGLVAMISPRPRISPSSVNFGSSPAARRASSQSSGSKNLIL